MMRKFCFLFLVTSTILLMVSFSLAQTPREGTSSEGKTTFTNIAVVGLDNTPSGTIDGFRVVGTPSYIEMVSSAGSTYYLYIGTDGRLRLASPVSVGVSASPATVGWANSSGVIVGLQ